MPVPYTHDAAGRLTQVQDWDGGTTVYTYTDAGRLSGVARPNGVTSAYSYNAAGRLIQIEHTDAADQLLARYTSLDGEGNRVGITETIAAPAEQTSMFLDDEYATEALAMLMALDEAPLASRPPGLASLSAYVSAGQRTPRDMTIHHRTPVTITGLTATVATGDNVSYTWNFGDGSAPLTTNGSLGAGVVTTHTYTAGSIYTVIVTATNSVHTVMTTTTVGIFEQVDVLITGLSATNDSPTPPGQVTTLTATVSMGSNVSYTWNFGDGTLGYGAVATHTYATVGTYTAVVTASNSANTVTATTSVTITSAPSGYVTTTRVLTYTYDPLNRLTAADYSTGEGFAYQYDAVGNRTLMTSTTPLSGTVVTTNTFDAANRLTNRAVSDGRTYTYTWSARGQLLAEHALSVVEGYTQGYPVRTFTYNGTGQLVRATVFTLTTEFTYNGIGARVAVSVTGQTTNFALDYAGDQGRLGNRILAETTPASTVQYLYGNGCLGEFRDDEPLYYLPDAEGYVRQGTDADGDVAGAWLFDPDGTVLEGPEGLVSGESVGFPWSAAEFTIGPRGCCTMRAAL